MICVTCLVRAIVDWSAVCKHSLGARQNRAAPSTSPSLRLLRRLPSDHQWRIGVAVSRWVVLAERLRHEWQG